MGDGSTAQQANVTTVRRTFVNVLRARNEVQRVIVENVEPGQYFIFETRQDWVYQLVEEPVQDIRTLEDSNRAELINGLRHPDRLGKGDH